MSSPSSRSIQALDKTTVRNLHSGQAIVDIETIVKELIENSLDANASSIDIKLVNKGLTLIQVKDNGTGIHEADRASMAVRYSTSKITSFDDIEKLTTLGFRGEALNSICAIAENMQVTTKTINDTIAKECWLERGGSVQSERPSSAIASCGTMVTVQQPFYNMPVRRQVAQKSSNAATKKVQELTTKYSLAYPKVRFSLAQAADTPSAYKRDTIWIKPSAATILDAVSYVFGTRLASMLQHCTHADDSVTLECLLPKANADRSIVNKGERTFVFVNKRPINPVRSELKELISTIRKRYRQAAGLSDESFSSSNSPFIYLDIQLNADQFDVNVEPAKNAIMLHQKQNILDLLEEFMDKVYGAPMERFLEHEPTPSRAHSPQREESTSSISSGEEQSARGADYPGKEASHQQQHEEDGTNSDADMVNSDEGDPRSSGHWKYSMFSQESDNDSVDEEQQLPDEESASVEGSRRVPMLDSWLASAENQKPTATLSTGQEQDTRHRGSFVEPQSSRSIMQREQPAPSLRQQHARVRATSTEPPSFPISAHRLQPESRRREQSLPPFESNDMDWQLERSSTTRATISTPPPQQWVSSKFVAPQAYPSASAASIRRPHIEHRRPSRSQPTLHEMLCPQHPALGTAEEARSCRQTLPHHLRYSTPSTSTNTPTHPRHLDALPIATYTTQRPSSTTAATRALSTESTAPAPSAPSRHIPQSTGVIPVEILATTTDLSTTPHDPPVLDVMRKRQRLMTFREHQNQVQQTDSQDLSDTLNSELSVSCCKERIRANYTRRYADVADLHHRQFDDASSFQSKPSDDDTMWHTHPLPQGLVLYTRSAKRPDSSDIIVYEIGAVDLPRASTLYAFHCLMENKELIAKRGLDKTIQMVISRNDPVYPVLSKLKSCEQCGIDENGQAQVYHRVTDRRITANGFQIQWREQQQLVTRGEIVMQIIAVYNLGTTYSYDVEDLRELLLLIRDQTEACVSYDDPLRRNLSMLRPSKVAAYLRRVAALPQAPERRASDTTIVKHLLIGERNTQDLLWRRKHSGSCEYWIGFDRTTIPNPLNSDSEELADPVVCVLYQMFQ